MSIFSPRLFFKKNSPRRGFTLVELLVVVIIIVVVTSVLLVRQSQFNSSTLLRSLSYGVALSMRQAQVYGTTVLGAAETGDSVATDQASCEQGRGVFANAKCFASGYGVYFSSGDAQSTPSQYRIFADINGNGAYELSPDERLDIYKIGSGYRISQFCAVRISGSLTDCWIETGGASSNLTSLSIVFERPNPDACFSTSLSPNACGTGSVVYSSASIQLKGDSGDLRTVTISSTGQIAVCAVNATSC